MCLLSAEEWEIWKPVPSKPHSLRGGRAVSRKRENGDWSSLNHYHPPLLLSGLPFLLWEPQTSEEELQQCL